MKTMSAKEAKNGFGLLLDTARAEPVTIKKHGRSVAVVLSIEAYERLVARKREIGRDRQVGEDEGGGQ
ncbi:MULTISPECIES: type II toxin-antitoxin system Phd/YefM family antitoxin [Alphaproteobacteria]|mgnify:CR=1 FL=1|jgi:prevent-host-death family protein|uniref:type II toxin-antitoxin system Phd/YefM family antitoxin n=1 Tax=Alphaproteobacteria TaxID=28211 RepID=UPI00329A62F0